MSYLKTKIPFAIWEGRYQPMHNGHLLYVKRMLESADRLLLVVLANEVSADFPAGTSPRPAFTDEVDKHHGSEKNPFPLWLRLMIVQSVLRESLSCQEAGRVFVSAGHRMDLDPLFYKQHLLPSQGVFLTPTRDTYEDSKASFWDALNRDCARIDVSNLPDISATEVRSAMANQSEAELDRLLPAAAQRLLREYGYT
ncbi:hypothetical protein LDO31_18530 [Luteimonas sp. XNQY3]|nr:hypothetical protein [Luteimonas sp. XNQY3]MCD9008195.1 hypothetical protein [Luteimonas sp. XNQY3]